MSWHGWRAFKVNESEMAANARGPGTLFPPGPCRRLASDPSHRALTPLLLAADSRYE